MQTTPATILSGIQPTGRLHVGNYLGALRNFVALQKTHQCLFMIADYHAITENYVPEKKRQEIFNLAVDFLAIGLDPKKSILFRQSCVPEHTELAWIFDTITPISYLERMTQYKDKASRQAENINAGLFTYPVLQAVDILLYYTDAVPVGQDQDQHLELTREIVRLFNNKFGKTFKEPKTLHTQTPKVMSLLEPERKMSKSLGEGHCIFIDDEPDVIQKKLSRAVTDSGDAKSPGGKNLLLLCQEFCAPQIFQTFSGAAKQGQLRYGELKTALGESLTQHFADYRHRKQQLLSQPKKVEKIFTNGSKQARAIAQKTMDEVRQKIGLR